MDDAEMTDAAVAADAAATSTVRRGDIVGKKSNAGDDNDDFDPRATEPFPSDEAGAHAMASTTMTTMTNFIMPKSRLHEIWSYFLQKLDKIDELERRVVQYTKRSRRRILNDVEQRQVWQKYRRSHARLFVTHHYQRKTGIWTLIVEGKLLIGNLDHQNATIVDTQGFMTQRSAKQTQAQSDCDGDGADGPPASKKAKIDDHDQDDAARKQSSLTLSTVAANEAMARNHQSIEEESNVEPLLFTHTFEKLEVTFRTIYQPRTVSSGLEDTKKTATKKERKKQKFNKMMGMEDGVDAKDLRASEPVKIEWYRTGQPPNDDNGDAEGAASLKPAAAEPTQGTPDAHAFFVKYNNHFSERPPPPNMKFYSIVANIKLYPKRPQPDDENEAFFQVSKTLAEIFFPHHSTEGGTQRNDNAEDLPGEAISVDPHQKGKQPGLGSAETASPIPLENAVHVPALLTYNEIASAIFQYIQDHKLHDAEDKSYIQCDKVLQDIFEVEGMSFSQLKQTLIEKRLIKVVKSFEEPVVMTYIMTESSSSKVLPDGFEEVVPPLPFPAPPATTPGPAAPASAAATDVEEKSSSTGDTGVLPAADQEPEGENPTFISFDMDVSLPSLYLSRARNFLRRGKCRELDHVSARSKARHLLFASKAGEDMLKVRMEQCISGRGYTSDGKVPIFLALAKAAPRNSEARMAAQIDARTCDLVARIEESGRLASTAWEAVDAAKAALTVQLTSASKQDSKELLPKYGETETNEEIQPYKGVDGSQVEPMEKSESGLKR